MLEYTNVLMVCVNCHADLFRDKYMHMPGRYK